MDRHYLTQQEIEKAYGKFTYTDQEDGAIEIAPEWIKQNIVAISTPFGKLSCHRKLKDTFLTVLEKAEKYIDKDDFKKEGGIWCPRHTMWDKTRSLSRHSWAIAIDVNVKDNPAGKKSKQPPELVKIMKDNGFVFGGDWNHLDPMHFEIGILL